MKIVLALLTAVLCLAADSPETTADSAKTVIEEGHFKRARAIIEPRFRANPKDAQAAHLLSRIHVAFGAEDSAERLAQASIAEDPGKPDYHAHLAHLYGMKLDDASTISKLSLVHSFKHELDATLALDPKHLDAMLMRAAFLWEAPGLVGGDKKKAESIIADMIKLNPERGYLAMGRLSRNQRNFGRMETAYQKALAINPQSFTAASELSFLYCCRLDTPRWDAAEKYARECIRIAPDRIAGYTHLARVLAAGQRWAELDALTAQSDKAVPDDLSPYYAAAAILRVSGKDLPRAERYARKYLTQEPEGNAPSQALAHYELALTLEKLGRKSEASTELKTVIAARPDLDGPKRDLKRLH
jgi:tetratricopeptide (TPR) repeat protein